MRYLLDTQVCFWAMFKSTKLSLTVKEIIQDTTTEILVSLWEIAIKYRLGKFSLSAWGLRRKLCV
jgi:PIN domain nuclease of toxin-antitoxin system